MSMNDEGGNELLMFGGLVAAIIIILIWCVGLYRTAQLIIGWIW